MWQYLAAPAAGAALGWIGSKVDDEGASKYISMPINWLTGDSLGSGAAAGLGAAAGMGGAGKLATSLGMKLPNTAAGWIGGRAGYLGARPLGAALGSQFRRFGEESPSMQPGAFDAIQNYAGGYLGGVGQPMALGQMYPELGATFSPAKLGWSPSPFGGQAPSTNIATYNDDAGLEGMLEDATAAANLPLQQAIKSRRDSQKKQVGVLKALGRDAQRDIRKTMAQSDKSHAAYEKLARETEKQALDAQKQAAKEVGDSDPDRAKSVEAAIRDDAQDNFDQLAELSDADNDRARGSHDSLLDLLEGLGDTDTEYTADKVATAMEDAQDDVNALKDQMASNAARINTDYRAQLAGTNMDASWNKYAMDYDAWDKGNYYGYQAALSNQSSLNAAKERLQAIYSGMFGSGLLPGPYGNMAGAGGSGGGGLVPTISSNLDSQSLQDLAAMGALGISPQMAQTLGNAEVKWSYE